MRKVNFFRIVVVTIFVLLAFWSVWLDYSGWAISSSFLGLFITELLISVGPELAGISIGFVTLDYLNEKRQEKLEIAQAKSQLIREMGSQSNDFAKRAIHELRHHGWLKDGSLKGKGFVKAHLEQTILINANLEETHFFQANLKGSDLRGANFKKANLMEAVMIGCRLMESDFEEANLFSADLQNVEAMKATFKDAKLVGAIMKGCNFFEANFQNADLNSAILVGSKFINADLTNVKLSGADLRYANFSGALLTGADLSGAILDQAVIDLEQLKSVASLEGVDHQRPDLRHQIEEHEKYLNWQKSNPEEEFMEHQIEEQERNELMNRNLREAQNSSSQKEAHENDS